MNKKDREQRFLCLFCNIYNNIKIVFGNDERKKQLKNQQKI